MRIRLKEIPMKNKYCYIVLLILLLFPTFVFSKVSDDNILNQVISQPNRQIKNFSFNPKSELISRVQAPPDFIIETWKQRDNHNDYAPYNPTQEEKIIISKSLEKLPPSYKEIFKERLAGIYFINNILGSGLADFVLDDKYNIYIYLVFNPNVLKTDISDWVTIKENTCFKKDNKDIKIKINCGKEYTGFMYILLHEGTHAIDYINNLTPYVESFMQELPGYKYENSQFIEGIWSDYNIINKNIKFPYQDNLTFYGMNNGPKLLISEAYTTYNGLLKTPFVSLYGSLNWAEDLSEYITFYYLTEELKQPYKISVFKKNEEFIFEPMKSESVVKRKEIIRSILKN